MANDLVFISWAGTAAKEIAEWLNINVFDTVGGVDAYVSSQMPTGVVWTNEVFKKLQQATAVLGIITDESVYRPWVLFELGAAHRNLDRIPILRFCEIPKDGHPLSLFQSHDCRIDDNVLRALSDLTCTDPRYVKSFQDNFSKHLQLWHNLKANLFDSPQGKAHTRLSQCVRSLQSSLRTFEDVNTAVAHPCMLEATCKSIEDVRSSLQSLAGNRVLTLEASRYPEYLQHLQQIMQCKVSAIAFVNRTEQFWSLRFGDLLRDSTARESRRLFVFDNPDELQTLFEKLWDHAAHYNVWLTSAKRLATICRRRGIEDDFSVLSDPATDDQILAYYQAGRIHFSVDRKMITEKLDAFDEMLNFAERVIAPQGTMHSNAPLKDRQAVLDGLMARAFGPSANPPAPQHSQAVSIFDYDNFEEDHPFYADMHRKMIGDFKRYVDLSTLRRVIEVGAGTGHFTKRLIGLVPNMKIIAVEPDGPSCSILRRRFEPRTNLVEIIEGRILDYGSNVPVGCVMSSFADHHISPSEKVDYFRHLGRLLGPGGVIIVGDEFLREYVPNSRADYASAVTAYHTYIIDIAVSEDKWQLANLERDALASGLAEEEHRVDFKISVSEYRDLAHLAGLEVLESTCVSDASLAAAVGGIYVFVLKPNDGV